MLPDNFRKKTFSQRLQILNEHYSYQPTGDDSERADSLIESAVGFVQIPVGIAGPLLINDRKRFIPIATEEPSVVMALNYGALMINRAGGVTTVSSPSVVTGQVVLLCKQQSKSARDTLHKKLTQNRERYADMLKELFASLHARGGGLRNCLIQSFDLLSNEHGEKPVNHNDPNGASYNDGAHPQHNQKRFGCVFEFMVDTVDAMGANRINTAAEYIAAQISKDTDAEQLISILSNSLDNCVTSAYFSLPTAQLPKHQYALKIVNATQFAHQNHKRAVTHNKGIMNAITGIALATGNDSRALEAAIHCFASQTQYTPLTNYQLKDHSLIGSFKAPLCLATQGGRIGTLHSTRSMLKICQIDNAADLQSIAATAGLVQNFAALLSLVSTGIQHGHMYYHCKDIAFRAGARDGEIDQIARVMVQKQQYSLDFAQHQLNAQKKS